MDDGVEVVFETTLHGLKDEMARLVGNIEIALREAQQIQSDIRLLIEHIETPQCA